MSAEELRVAPGNPGDRWARLRERDDGASPPTATILHTTELHAGWFRVVDAEARRSTSSELSRRFASAIACGLLSVQQDVAPDTSDDRVVVRPAGKVGFASSHGGAGSVRVDPKVAGADYVRLMLLAEGVDGLEAGHSSLLTAHSDTHDLTVLLVAALVDAVRSVVRGTGLRRLHQPVDETLRARVRGRVQVGRYMREFGRGRPTRVPCAFERHDVDNLPNRTLRTGLMLARALARARLGALANTPEASSGLLHAVVDEARALHHIFDAFGVGQAPVRAVDLRGLVHLPSGFSGYRRALRLAALLIRHASIVTSHGEVRSIALAVDMAATYEKAFECSVKSWFDDVRAQSKWPLEIGPFGSGHSEMAAVRGHLRPDVVIAGEDGRAALVLDTKWKSVLADAEPTAPAIDPDAGVRIADDVALGSQVVRAPWVKSITLKYADLYQMWSYCQVLAAREARPPGDVVGGLVYPVVGADGASAVEVRPEVRPAEQQGPMPRLFLVPWDVSRAALQAGSVGLRECLEAIRASGRAANGDA